MTATAVADREVVAVPRWAPVVTEALCLLGLAVSVYLTYEHFNNPTGVACPATGIFDCVKVVTSSYSVILGVPVPVAGLAFFVVMAALCSPRAWRSGWTPLLRLRMGASVVGVGMILWLIYVELFRLDVICPWCTSVHVITVVLFMTIAFATAAATSLSGDRAGA